MRATINTSPSRTKPSALRGSSRPSVGGCHFFCHNMELLLTLRVGIADAARERNSFCEFSSDTFFVADHAQNAMGRRHLDRNSCTAVDHRRHGPGEAVTLERALPSGQRQASSSAVFGCRLEGSGQESRGIETSLPAG